MNKLLDADQYKKSTFDKKSDFNSFVLISDKLAIEAKGTRIVVLEDKFRTGKECPNCFGAGYTDQDCETCQGTSRMKSTFNPELTVTCTDCGNPPEAEGNPAFAGAMALKPGKKRCDCLRPGSGRLVLPEKSKQRPSSGVIVSKGPQAQEVEIGDHVLYAQTAGTRVTLGDEQVIIIMHADEVIATLWGVKGFTLEQAV